MAWNPGTATVDAATAVTQPAWVGTPGGNTAPPAVPVVTPPPTTTTGTGRGDPIPSTPLPDVDNYKDKEGEQFNPSGWTKTGGTSVATVYTNTATGAVVVVAPDGKVIQGYTAEEAATHPSFQILGPQNTTDQATQVAHDAFNDYVPNDPAGTPTISGSDNPVDAVNGVKNKGNGVTAVTVNPDGTISGPGVGGGGGTTDLTNTPQYQSLVAFANQLQQQRDAFGGGTQAGQTAPIFAPHLDAAAQMQAAQSAGAPAINPAGLGASAQQIAAPTIKPLGSAQAPTIAAPQVATAQQIGAPGAIGAQQVQAQQIGQVGLGAGADATRASQQAAIALQRGAAEGTAPSAAEALLRKGIDENVGTALGMAATLQGSRPGMALHQGLAGAKGAIAKSAADAAALRAQEQATGRQQFAEATQGARAQDIQAASTNLQAQIDTLKANQQTALAAGNSNAANALQAQIQTVQAQLDASKANQASALQAVLANQSQTTDVAKSQAALQMQAQITTLQQQLDVAKSNAANALAAGQSNQAAALQAQIATMNSQLDALKSNQAAALSTSTTNAGLTQQANLTNANLAQNQSQFGATQQLTAQDANQKAALMQQQLNNQQYLGLTQLQQQADIAPYSAMVQQQQIAQQQAAANQAFWGQLIAAGATAFAASDVTLKEDIASGADAALDFLDTLDPKTYRYKDERNPLYHRGKQLGVIAQDLPPAVVTTGPDGKKWISANVIGQVLAGLGSTHQRLKKLEGGKPQGRETTRLTRRAGGDTVPPSDLAEFARKLAS